MASLLKGSAFITGAASGIGKATAIAFARHGISRLAIADVNNPALNTFQEELKKSFPSVDILPLHMDVRSNEQVTGGIAATARAFGRLDVAVNNAGTGGKGFLTHKTEDEEIERILDVNLHGVYRCQKQQLALMVEQEDLGAREGRGHIINVASMYGIVAPYHGFSHTAYTTAKHGVIGLTKADANSYSSYNIRLNAIAPGYVATPLTAAIITKGESPALEAELKRSPLQRLATQEEIADAIVVMASPMLSYMQGAVQVVDGGFTSN